MLPLELENLRALRDKVGQKIVVSDWLRID